MLNYLVKLFYFKIDDFLSPCSGGFQLKQQSDKKQMKYTRRKCQVPVEECTWEMNDMYLFLLCSDFYVGQHCSVNTGAPGLWPNKWFKKLDELLTK